MLRQLHAWVFDKALHHRKLYYVSWGKLALLYFDIDLHYAWQTKADGQEAQALLSRLVPQLFWMESSRGYNGYLKVDIQSQAYPTANQVFERSEKALQLYLASQENRADFEIKGRIGHLQDGEYCWQQYGKLPIHAASWNFPKLREFQSKPVVPLRMLNALCDHLEARIPQEVLERHQRYKQRLGTAPIERNGLVLVTPAIQKELEEQHGELWRYLLPCCVDKDGSIWLEASYLPDSPQEKTDEKETAVPAPLAKVVEEAAPAPARHPVAPPGRSLRAAGSAGRNGTNQRYPLDTSDLLDEPDSFQRQKEALRRFARCLKRVPTEEEAQAFLHEQRLFSGSWEEHRARRAIRVRSILRFIATTFDASKCAQGSVNVGKCDAWVKEHFPRGLRGGLRRRYALDGTMSERPGLFVSARFIASFLSVSEFALLTDQNQDSSFPHKRAKAIWDALYGKGLLSVPFCARKWATCREEMVKYGVIHITNRHYSPGKAMQWAPGAYFPFLGLWKAKKQRSLQGSGCLQEKKRREKEHNTLLHSQAVKSPQRAQIPLSRPPPEPLPAVSG